ncbi:MAG: response regulator [Planctomycetes bacterium]|nr:response regulator [Planctomycetota bacterium]
MSVGDQNHVPAKDERDRLLAENRLLAQRYLELESNTRKQLDKLRSANDVLARGESHMRILLENAAVGFALLDLNLRIVNANHTLAEALGYPQSDLPGEDFTAFIYVAKLPAFNRMVSSTPTRTKTTETIELVARDGRLVPSRMAVSDWYDDAGVVRGMFILVFNLGEEKQTEERLRELEDTVAEMSKSRRMFIDVISRELRAPASSIMGMIRMLMDGSLTERQAELAGVVHSSASSLVRLVDDLVDVSRLDSDDVNLNPRPVRPDELAKSAVQLFQTRAEEKGLELTLALAPELPEKILADAQRVRRVLTHLLDNAIKFTEKGKVTLSVDMVGENIRFMVSDTGGGIRTRADVDILSERPVSDSAAVRKHGGVGLGLSISRRLVSLMGGKLGYETEPGRGSEFHFTIPALIPESTLDQDLPPPPPEAIQLPPMKILLADGNPMSRNIARAILRYDGHSLTESDSGIDAAARCRAARFDLVILELHLPKLDGLQTLRLIREEERTAGKPRTPILILGPSGQLREEAFYIRAGADGVVKKPFQPVDLMAAAAKATGAKPIKVARVEPPVAYAAETSGGSLRRIDGVQLVNIKQVMLDDQFIGILRFFMDDAVPGIIALEEMASSPEPDPERIAFAANKAKGLSSYLGFSALADVLGRLELAAADPSPTSQLGQLSAELAVVVDDTLEELKRILPEAFATLTSITQDAKPDSE